MTHAEVRDRLRAYSNGTLDEASVERVRAHLASGCGECLRQVFTRPVGLPRIPVVVRRPPRRLLAAALLVGAGIGAGLGLLVGAARRGATPPSGAAVETLASEVERLRHEREDAETRARERLERLEARVVESERQAPPEPPVVKPLAPAAPGPNWLDELLASPGASLLPLRPAESAPGASGYAIWSRARGVVVVSASNLPAGRSDAVYRVRVTLNGGATVWAGDLPASDQGTLVVTATMPEGMGWRVTGVDLYRDPPNAPALTANLRP